MAEEDMLDFEDEEEESDASDSETAPEEEPEAPPAAAPPAAASRAEKERYRKLEARANELEGMLKRFYQDEAYARQVVAQRFGGSMPASPAEAPSVGLAASLREKLAGTGLDMLAEPLAEALAQVVDSKVQEKVKPVEQRFAQQSEQAREQKEQRVLAWMDEQYPGWEDAHGQKMTEMYRFIASGELEHPEFGNVYDLMYRLANPDVARIAAQRATQGAARQRTSLGRTGRRSVPNIEELVRQAESPRAAFAAAAKAARGELNV